VLTHEGRWTIRLDHTTGEVHVTRPNGQPYELGPNQPYRPTPTNRPHQPDRPSSGQDRGNPADDPDTRRDLPDAA
jgi:hypothetical protein